jgi:NAD(P)-dependent dehydrogenase (short-subunit alcohol dehydrogenase family)
MSSPSSLFSVAGKNVLVTGSSRGIGLMIAKGFVNAGANVLVTSRSEEACQEAAKSINCNHYVASNVGSREGCEQLVQHVAEVFDNRLHVLVNNAGTSWGEPLERKSGKANWGFDKVLDLVCTFAKRGRPISWLWSFSFTFMFPSVFDQLFL